MYSSEEIEKKRLLALKLRQTRNQKLTTSTPQTTSSSSSLSKNNQNIQTNALLKRINNSTTTAPTSQPPPSLSSKNNQNIQPNTLLKRVNNSNPIISSPPSKQQKLLKPIEPKNFFTHINVIKGTCYMLTSSRFEVDVPYHQPLIEFFKKIPTNAYNQKSKLWNFSVDQYENFREKLKLNLPQVALIGLPKFVLQTFLNRKSNNYSNSDEDLTRIDRKLWDSLMPFQKEGVTFGVQKKGRCFIADDMGLGKTIQALGIAHYYIDDWPLLIVSPSSVRFQWSDTIFEYLPSIPIQHVHQFTNAKDQLGSEKITVTSYDLLSRAIHIFEKKRFGVIILDESHSLKNHKAERTKAVQRLTNNANRIILLSGTPALSRPIELYSQLSMIMGSFMRLQEYGLRYCNGKKSGYGWDYSGTSNITELQLLLRERCLIRRLKSDVLRQLPPKLRQVIILDPNLIDGNTKEMVQMVAKLQQNTLKGIENHSTMIQLYSASSTQKLRAVRNYVRDLVEKDKKFLIFAHHQCILTTICEVLDEKKIQYIKIDGKTNAESRKLQVDQFQNCEKCLVAVLSITAANSGITLTAAHFVVFAELYWNPGILVQAEDRVHRIGQNSSVLIQYLVAKETVDDYLWPLLQKKLRFLTKAGLNQDFSLNDVDVSMQKQKTNEQHSPNYSMTQTKMDSFLNISNSSDSSQNLNNIDQLLDEDEEDFANIDWDSIV